MHAPFLRGLSLSIACSTAALAQGPIDATKAAGAPAQAARLVATSGAPSSLLSSWSDNFNRPDGTPLGPDWTDVLGTFGIMSNAGYHLGTSNAWTQHNTASANYDAVTASIDFLPKVQGSNLVYVALIFGTGASSDNVFLKVQDNNSDGLYDRVFFYRGINGGPWTGSYYFDLSVPTPSGRMTCYFTNNGDTANLDIDRDFDNVVDDAFQASGLLGAGLQLGTGLGIGNYNSPAFDNWTASDGPPGPVIFNYCTAGTTTNGCNASMGATGTPSASATSGFTLTASNVEGQKTGLIFYGLSGQLALPWGTGSTSFLCVKPPTQRTPVQPSGGTFGGCDGSLSLDLLAWLAANPGSLGTPVASATVP
jgi:hypothetical protein